MKKSLLFGSTMIAATLFAAACGEEAPQTTAKTTCGGEICTDDQKCENDKCVPKETTDPQPGECDPECTDGKVCKDGKCVDGDTPDPGPKACDPACGEGKTCENGECKDIQCPSGENLCGNACYNLKSDINNCGECGNSCGAKTCFNGECRFVCDNGLATCETGCVDLKTDLQNCGDCGNACDENESCVNGKCSSGCDASESLCDGECVNLNADAKNCGECGNACNEGESCQNKVCKQACDAGQDPCNGKCVDLDSDNDNCSVCGNKCSTDAGESCYNGTCKVVCRENEQLCGTKCIDLKSNKDNCGECGNACEEGEKCNAGVCGKDCGDLVDCNGNCIDPNTSADFCGASDTCTDDKAGEKCGDGFTCQSGKCACADQGASQCAVNDALICTDPNTDNAHCGCGPDDAGMNCTGLGGTATSACNAGKCEFTCLENFKDCDGAPANGCEADLSSIENCGACGNKCEDANADKAMCIAGSCSYECKAGTSLCGGHCLDLSADDDNCGACGNKCGEDAKCQNGFCTIPLNKCVGNYVTTKINGQQVTAYCLRSSLELESMRNKINAGGKYPDDNNDNAYILMKDIDLETIDWAPIGTASHAFTGTFLGNGKTISGKLSTNGSNVGFFGYVSKSILDGFNLKIDLTAKGSGIQHIGGLVGYIINSSISNSKIVGAISDPNNGSGTYDRLGGLVGYMVSSSITNCSSQSDILFNGRGENGGLIGMLQGSTVENCSSNSTIKINQNIYYDAVGGLVGWAWYSGCSEIKNSFSSGTIDLNKSTQTSSLGVGGLVGWQESCQIISDSYSSVNITANAAYRVGGLTGNIRTSYTPNNTTTITNSYATGTVACRTQCGGLNGYGENLKVINSHATGKVNGTDTCGGLLGYGYRAVDIKSSYATGDVETTGNAAGGLIGSFNNSVADTVYATGEVKTKPANATNAWYTGGAIGYLADSAVTNIYATGAVSGYIDVGGLIGQVRRSTITNGFASGNATSPKLVSSQGYSVGGLFGSVYDSGNSSITNCVGLGNSAGSKYVGTTIGYVGIGNVTLRNIYGTGTVTGDNKYTNAFIGVFDNQNIEASDRHGGSLAIKNSYYWAGAAKNPTGGSVPNEAQLYGLVYKENQAVLEDDDSVPLASMLGEDWTEVTCKLSSGPATENAGDYKIPVPKVFGASVCK